MTNPKHKALAKAREMRRMAGDDTPGTQLSLDETWEWPLSQDAAGKPVIDPAFFARVKADTGKDLTPQQAYCILDIWYKQVLNPHGFTCPVMERIIIQGRLN